MPALKIKNSVGSVVTLNSGDATETLPVDRLVTLHRPAGEYGFVARGCDHVDSAISLTCPGSYTLQLAGDAIVAG